LHDSPQVLVGVLEILIAKADVITMVKPRDYAPLLNGVMWCQVTLAFFFIVLRMYTRHYIVRNLGWDDVVMVVNLVCINPTYRLL
jgi:hypothetical protein